MNVELSVAGEPKGQPRIKSRSFMKGGKPISMIYTPKTADHWKSLVRLEARLKAPRRLLEGPLIVTLTFYMPRPKSHYRTGKYSDQLKDNAPTYHDKKPDVDNMVKAVFDAIGDSKVIWKDDNQVAAMNVLACYSEEPGAKIKIRQLLTDDTQQSS